MPTTRSTTSERQGPCASCPFASSGLCPIQVWVPDVRSSAFAREAPRQPALIDRPSPKAGQPFIDADIGVAFQVKRGHRWALAGAPDYTGKRRPAIILQGDAFDGTAAMTVCPLHGAMYGGSAWPAQLISSRGGSCGACLYRLVAAMTSAGPHHLCHADGLARR